MKAIDYISAKWYMNTCCTIDCGECPLSQVNNGTDSNCVELERIRPSKAVAIVEKWAAENPESWVRLP